MNFFYIILSHVHHCYKIWKINVYDQNKYYGKNQDPTSIIKGLTSTEIAVNHWTTRKKHMKQLFLDMEP